jgi:hypothetical protein
MWQTCPVCKGVGKVPYPGISSTAGISVLCTVCRGMKIISELTGKPPGEISTQKPTQDDSNIPSPESQV